MREDIKLYTESKTKDSQEFDDLTQELKTLEDIPYDEYSVAETDSRVVYKLVVSKR